MKRVVDINENGRTEKIIEKFINSCSHELKSPLSSIQGLVEIASYYPGHEESKKCLDMISSCVGKMENIIRSLEEYMVNARKELSLQEVDGEMLIDEILFRYSNTLSKQSIHITKEVDQTCKWITDPRRVTMILNNLISNAIAFQDTTKKDKRIKVRLMVYRHNSFLEVADNGIGINSQRADHIFDLFYRASDQSTGYGLGLFVVKGIIAKMEARLSFETIENQGSKFKVAIPNNKAA